MTQREKELTEQVERLTKLVNALVQELAKAKAEIAELKEQLNKNSRNSSKPPSTDGYRKPAPKSLCKPSAKKQGGQAGHKGSTLKVNIAPTDIEAHMPVACTDCPVYEECLGRACAVEARRVIDAKVNVRVTEHRSMELVCPYSNIRMRGEFLENIQAPVQYGDNPKAMVVAFNTVGAVSATRIHEIFGGVFNIPLSTGTIANMVRQFSELLEAPYAALKAAVVNMLVGHFDETGSRVDGHTKWVHVVSNDCLTYLYLETSGDVPQWSDRVFFRIFTGYWFMTVSPRIGNMAPGTDFAARIFCGN